MRHTLLDMLTYCRPAGSKSETKFVRRYLLSLPGANRDRFGNIHVQIGESPTVLWSAHTDTVHRRHGRQTIAVSGDTVTIARNSRSNCLGADNTAGVYMLREMILRGVPGHYVFHYGEEIGGLGSRDIAENVPDWVRKFSHAIAFDRRGTQDVITHQGYGRSCSDDLAWELAIALNTVDSRLEYYPSDRGIFTDTANYMELIPECTNVSVGYQNEHSPGETLDLGHVDRLLSAVCQINVSGLPVSRDPIAETYYPSFDWPDETYDRELFVICTSCLGTGRDEYGDVCRECLGVGEVLEYVTGTKAEITGRTLSESLKAIGDRQARRTYGHLRKLW